MNWDAIGALINIGTVIFAAGGVVWTVTSLGKRMASLEEQMKQMTQVLISQATQQVRLDNLDQRMTSLAERIEGYNQSAQSLVRMVESNTSRVNNLIERKILVDGR